MFWNWISFELNIVAALTIWFGAFLLHFKFNLGYFVRKLLRVKQTQDVKVLDCFPCLSFWITLFVTLNPVVAMTVYFMAVLTEKR